MVWARNQLEKGRRGRVFLGTGDEVVGDLPRVRIMMIKIKKAW